MNEIKKRNTKQRKIIYEVVQSLKDHPDAEEIYKEVHKIDPKISKGTIYRNLNDLSKMGEINHVKVPGVEADRFDYRLDNHYHIICEICGKVIDSKIEYDLKEDAITENESGFKILRHRTVFEGICPDCLNKNKEKNK